MQNFAGMIVVLPVIGSVVIDMRSLRLAGLSLLPLCLFLYLPDSISRAEHCLLLTSKSDSHASLLSHVSPGQYIEELARPLRRGELVFATSQGY